MKDVNILLFLSDYKPMYSEVTGRGAKEEHYCLAGTQKKYTGIQTNDAPIRYMFEQARNKEANIKRVLCLTSYKVSTEPSDKSQLDRFKEFIHDIATKELKMDSVPDVISIPYDYDPDTEEKVDFGTKLPVLIYSKLSDCFREITDGEEVYIDYTGGFRDISFLMTSIIRFLEFKGLICGEIVYSNFQEKKLFDIHYIYDIYQLINGVSEFTNTGNARELVEASKGYSGDNKAGSLIRGLISFSDALSICDIGGLDDKAHNLVNAISDLENSEEEDITAAMIKTLTPIIRKKMYLEEGVSYPTMIKWCAENNMIQQAATIYTDKMPKYYFDNGLVPDYVDLDKITVSPGHSKWDTGFYTELFDRAAEGLEVDVFRASLKSILKPVEINKELNLTDVISRIENKMDSEANEIIRGAYSDLLGFITACYEDTEDGISTKFGAAYDLYHKTKYEPLTSGADSDGCILIPGTIPATFLKFWEALISNKNYWTHRFLYNEEANYLAIEQIPRNSDNKSKIYRKKAFAIKRIMEGKIALGEGIDREKTCKRMAYYLAVKIMRNRMNHAGESERSNDEVEAIRTLNNLGLGIHFEDDLASYREILLKGIEI